MSTLANDFTDFLSKVEQMEKDNEKLNKDIQKLEIEKADGWAKFNTDTHALIERRELNSIVNRLDDIECDVSNVSDEVESARNTIDDASYTASDLEGSVRDVRNDLEDIMPKFTKEEVAE